MLKGLQDYFLGKDISDFYDQKIEQHPENARSLELEKNVKILYGKVLPNLLTLAGISTILGGDVVSGGFIIGGSETWRNYKREDFQFTELHYTMENLCDAFDKATVVSGKRNDEKE